MARYQARTTDKPGSSLSGWRAISLHLAVCESTARDWNRSHGLPVMWRPDGRVYTTVSLIDQWVMARAKLRWQQLGNKTVVPVDNLGDQPAIKGLQSEVNVDGGGTG